MSKCMSEHISAHMSSAMSVNPPLTRCGLCRCILVCVLCPTADPADAGSIVHVYVHTHDLEHGSQRTGSVRAAREGPITMCKRIRPQPNGALPKDMRNMAPPVQRGPPVQYRHLCNMATYAMAHVQCHPCNMATYPIWPPM